MAHRVGGDQDPGRLIVSIKGVLRVNNNVMLCMNHRNEWELPGGRPDGPGEQPRDTCAREIVEESGVAVDVADRPLLARNVEVVPGQWVLIVAYACTPVSDVAVETSEEHVAIRLFTDDEAMALDNLPQVYRDAIALSRPDQVS